MKSYIFANFAEFINFSLFIKSFSTPNAIFEAIVVSFKFKF